ncbi:MAG: hypothetical protein AAGE83_13275 [Pseudomonadota bacterium]
MLSVLAMTFMTATRSEPLPAPAPRVAAVPCTRRARRYATRLGAVLAFLRAR